MTAMNGTPPPKGPAPLPPRQSKKTKKRAGFFKKLLQIVVVAVSLLTVVLVAFGIYLAEETNELIDKIGTSAPVAPSQSAKVKPLSFLLLGLDTRKETGSMNTDVIMVTAVNPESKTATVVSIPRDTYLRSKDGWELKANGYYAEYFVDEGSFEGASKPMKKLFGDYLQIPIDHTVVVNFTFFSDLVDSLGGITVEVDKDMRYQDHADGTNIDLKKGVRKLTGKQALDFVRYRMSNDGSNASSDFERNERQQKVIAELAAKLKSPAGLTNIGGVLGAAGNNMKTDIPSKQISELLRTYLGISGDKITYIHLSGEWRSPFVHIDPAQLEEARASLKQQLGR